MTLEAMALEEPPASACARILPARFKGRTAAEVVIGVVAGGHGQEVIKAFVADGHGKDEFEAVAVRLNRTAISPAADPLSVPFAAEVR